MQTIRKSYRGLSLLLDLNADLLGAVFLLALALLAGAWVLAGQGQPPLPGSI